MIIRYNYPDISAGAVMLEYRVVVSALSSYRDAAGKLGNLSVLAVSLALAERRTPS